MMSHVLAFGMPSMGEWVVVAFIGLIFFGKRLPEVGRSLGKGIVEFKKGLKGIEEEIEDQVDASEKEQQQRRLDQKSVAEKPKFDPYTGKPVVEPGHKFDPYTGKPIESEPAGTASNASSDSSEHG